MIFPDVKPGDSVALMRSWAHEPLRSTVDGASPDVLIVRNCLYSRHTGRRVGHGESWVQPWTPEIERDLAESARRKAKRDAVEQVRARVLAALTVDAATLTDAQIAGLEDLAYHFVDQTRAVVGGAS